MRTRARTVLPALLVAIAAGWLAPIGVGAASGAVHASVTITLNKMRVEHGAAAAVKFCWKDTPIGWTAEVTSANAPQAVPQPVFATIVSTSAGCFNTKLPTGARGVHPIKGQLITPGAVQEVTAVTFLYVYAPTQGSVFLKHILNPACHGSGAVVIDGRSMAWTCSMRAVTSHLTVGSTTCRNATLQLASTDDRSGDASSPGKSIFELAQNVVAPSFKRFHDDVVAAKSLPLSGSAFWVAFKSTNAASRLYFLNQGAAADCYTSSGTP